MLPTLRIRPFLLLLASSIASVSALAHDPIFGLGPHVVYKEGVEIALESTLERAGPEREGELALELTYGLTGDWAVGIDLPYRYLQDESASSQGAGDLALFSKYRFWRQDRLGSQSSAAIALKVIPDTADNDATPALGKGSTDALLGLTYGYESRRWYRWASLRYRRNGTNPAGVNRGDRILLDFVAGWRPRQSHYLEPDTVWLLELNGERSQSAKRAGQTLRNTGGQQWFVSPGIFWTLRNFAIKAGVQIPIHSNLNGNQPEADYRARLTLEWHL